MVHFDMVSIAQPYQRVYIWKQTYQTKDWITCSIAHIVYTALLLSERNTFIIVSGIHILLCKLHHYLLMYVINIVKGKAGAGYRQAVQMYSNVIKLALCIQFYTGALLALTD